MFQIKNFDSIVASMINKVTATSGKLTDFNVGSTLRTILEATANEIDQYYQTLLKGLYEAVPVAVYKSFSFERKAATAASGVVTFTRDPEVSGDIEIPGGTRMSVPNASYYYTVDDDAVILNGENTIDAIVTATVAGSATNCLLNTITIMVDEIEGVASVTNAYAFSNGTDDETDNERKLRFQLWLNTLARSTRDSILYGATTACLKNSNGTITEQVIKALVHEPCIDDDPAGDVGQVDVYLWNGSTGASSELLAEASKILHGYVDDNGDKVPGWKAAGILLSVYAVSVNSVNVTATITLKTDYTEDTVGSLVETVIDDYFQGLEIGESFIWSRLVSQIMDVEGVKDVSLTAPTGNVDPTDWNYIIAKGTVSLTCA